MAPDRKYWTNAERQAAYRKRHHVAKQLSLDVLHKGLRQLRREITRCRKEHKDRATLTNWSPLGIRKVEQTNLLDYIEAELDRLMEGVKR